MEETTLYTCFEAKIEEQEYVYMIYSAKVSDLLITESDSS